MLTGYESTELILDNELLEDQLRQELYAAFTCWEEAPSTEKPDAEARLNRAVRQLYDFVVRGKSPEMPVLRGKARAAFAASAGAF
jgi:hypothetical protein